MNHRQLHILLFEATAEVEKKSCMIFLLWGAGEEKSPHNALRGSLQWWWLSLLVPQLISVKIAMQDEVSVILQFL